jgi:hypothetical protein
MKKIAISLCLFLLLNLCGCSLVPVGTNTSNIETLKSWSFQYNEGTNDYSVFFALLNDSERYVSADVDADIRIVNDNGEEVYKGTHSVSKEDFGYYSSQAAGEQYLANLKIPASNITAGTSAKGKVYITIYKDEFLRFDEVNCEALYCLPIKDVQINATSLPKDIIIKGYDGKIESKIRVESVTYIYEKEFAPQLKITVTGTKTYGSSSSYDMIKYKIYDSKKFVVEDGIFYLSSLCSGDKFKNDSIIIYDVVPGETYSIDFFEYS